MTKKKKGKEFRGRVVVIRYNADVCIHSRECVEGLPEVFDIERHPWVDADGADVDDIEEVVARCPSGALSCERIDPDDD
jgi:uncharacterized Fe-S cluster protein YjdI